MADANKPLYKNLKEIPQKQGPFLGVRHLQATLLFLNIIVALNFRFSVSVSIVAMTNAAKSNPDFPEYDWSEQQKSYIISSFFWGYILTLIPGGYYTKRYGVRINLFISTLGAGISSLLVPLCVSWGGWQMYCAVRFLQGVMQGNLFPAIMQHLAKWSPPAERNCLGGFVISGFDVGTALAMALPGLIAAGKLGWPGQFYVSAMFSFIWCAIWLIFGANDPTASKYVKPDERAYIETSLSNSCVHQNTKIPIPWHAILTSKPFWALLIANCASGWSFITLITELPSYMNGVLDMHIGQNGLYSASIFIASALMTYVYVFLAEVIMKRKLMSLTFLRKGINTVSMWIPAAGLVWFGFIGPEQKTFAVILMALIVSINSGSIIGINLGAIDLSPNHAGVLESLLSISRSIASTLAPIFTGFIVKSEHNRSQWQIVFNVAAFIFCAGDVVFFIFGSAKQQPWDAPDYLQTKAEARLYEPKYSQKGTESNKDTAFVNADIEANCNKQASRVPEREFKTLEATNERTVSDEVAA